MRIDRFAWALLASVALLVAAGVAADGRAQGQALTATCTNENLTVWTLTVHRSGARLTFDLRYRSCARCYPQTSGRLQCKDATLDDSGGFATKCAGQGVGDRGAAVAELPLFGSLQTIILTNTGRAGGAQFRLPKKRTP